MLASLLGLEAIVRKVVKDTFSTEELAISILKRMEVKDQICRLVAEKVNYSELAEKLTDHIGATDIAREVEVDWREVAENADIDYDTLATHLDLGELSIDYDDLVSALLRRVKG